MPLADVTTPGGDGRLLVEAVAASPEEDTPKFMLIDYLNEFDDPRAGMLLGCTALRQIPLYVDCGNYVHGDYAAPPSIHLHRAARGAGRILAIALLRRTLRYLFASAERTRYPNSTWSPGVRTAPENVDWGWLGRYLGAAELYACHLLSPASRDEAMRAGDRSASSMIADCDKWWVGPPVWSYYSPQVEAGRVRALLIACRAGKGSAHSVYESVGSILRDYNFGHAQTHCTCQAVVAAWEGLALWGVECGIYTLQRQEKLPSLYGGKVEEDASSVQ